MSSKVVEQHIPCPSCPSSDAYCVYDDGHGYCYACNYFQPPEGKSFNDIMYTFEYIPHRGLTRKTLETYDIKTKVDDEGKPVAVGFLWPNGSYQVRSFEHKEYRWDTKSPPPVAGLYGRDKFSAGSHKYVIITEGVYDAASCFQTTGCPSVSVRSCTTAVADCSADRSWLNSFDRIYLGFDADAPGREALRSVARLFDYNKVLVLDFDRRKDANEYLQAGEADQLSAIWNNAKKYLPETIVAVNKGNIRSLIGKTPKIGVPYPFKRLNEMTYGIRRGESVLITAQEGVGKTQVMHAIEHQLLRETDDAIAAIYLEEDKPDHLRALASIELQRPANLPDSGISEDDIVSAIEKSTKNDDRLYIYNHFGSDDPDVLLDTVRFLVTARNVVYILLDHFGMCVSGIVDEKDERRKLDYLSTRFAMMLKELDFSFIFVSHVNDHGQTRGSRLIAKDCHVRINLDRDFMNEDPTIQNIVHASVSKNRPPSGPGKTGPAGSYLYDSYTHRYTEVANDNTPIDTAFASAA